jgi:alpha-1,3-rhamnosyltransferase
MNSAGSEPLVSILVPSFNHARYVRQSIEAVVGQDYRNIELIVIDDGSSDDSVAEIAALADACARRFVRFEFRARDNRGLAATINEAVAWAAGDYFATIASDDILKPNKTSTLVREIAGDAADVAAVFAGCEIIDADGRVVGVLSPTPRYYGFDDVILHKQTAIAPTQLIRLQALKDAGGYPADIRIEDWYMWLALTARGGRLKVVAEPLVQYRRHEGNSSGHAAKMHAGRIAVLEHFRQHPLYPLAVANVCVSAAIELSCASKRQSLGYLRTALGHSRAIAGTRRFANASARLLAPCFLVRPLARLKAWLQARRMLVPTSW